MERGDLTALTWRVDHVLVDGGFGFLYGKKGSLKTFTAIDMAERIVRGRKWRGYRVEKGPVLYVAAEDFAGVKMRHEAWLKHYGEDESDLLDFIRSPINLMDWATVEDLAAFVLERQHKVIIFDTLHRSMGFGEGSEMSDTDTAQITGVTSVLQQAYYANPDDVPFDPSTTRGEFIGENHTVWTDKDGSELDPRPWTEEELREGCRWIQQRFQWWPGAPATIFVHHPNQRTNTLRGFGGFYGDTDMILRMTRRRDGSSAMLAEKVKNWTDQWTIRFRLQKVEGSESCVVVDGANGNANDEKVLARLEERPGQTFSELKESTELANATLNRTLGRLTDSGDVEEDDDRRYWLA